MLITLIIIIITEVLLQTLRDFFAKAKYVSLTGDGIEAWKIREEKELVYGKVLLKCYQRFVPSIFFLACHSLKAFGGPTADVTNKAMLHASFSVCRDVLEKIVY